jgi:hypothetical protein
LPDILASAGASCGSCIDQAGNISGKPDTFIAVFETAGDGPSSAFRDFYAIGIDQSGTGNPNDATFSFASDDGSNFQLTAPGKAVYGHASPNLLPVFFSGTVQSGPVSSGVEQVAPGYVSERGSKLESVAKDEVRLSMAHRLAKAVWKLIE